MSRYINYILFLFVLIVLIVFIALETPSKISTNLSTILPDSKNKELLETYLKYEQNKKLFLTVQGTSKESLKKLRAIEKQLLLIDGVEKKEFLSNQKLQEFKKRYFLYLNKIDTEKLENLNIENELKKIYSSLFDSFFIPIIDKNDPLKLIQKNIKNIKLKNGRLVLDGYGYLTILNINNSKTTIQEYEQIYDEIKKIELNNSDIKSFSFIYYFVENSRYIKADATKIAVIATLLLLSLYLIVLRNISLLLNTLLSLGTSALVATIVVTSIYPTISIFVLVFGLSISTIAIDYMFHHYFHGKYESYKGFTKEVFLGFFTTFGVFLILSFSEFLLIKQITLFAMCSLFISYVLFSFIFPYIQFKSKEINFGIKSFKLIDKKYIFISSLFVLVFAVLNLKFDFNIESLNYDNKELKKQEEFFKSGFEADNRIGYILQADTIDQLIVYNELIKNIDTTLQSPLNSFISKEKFLTKKEKLDKLNIHKLKQEIEFSSKAIGFKEGYFKQSYNYQIEVPSYSYELLKEYGVNIQKFDNKFICFISISKDKVKEMKNYQFLKSVSLKNLFEQHLQNEFKTITLLGIVSLVFIFIVMGFISKEKIVDSFNFLLFPSGIIFLYFTFIEINILHLFMFFIILAICIDYGIYLSKSDTQQTQKAIIFSALSSFAGFGVLIFSTTPSLFSIGSVATLGIIAILILIFFVKGKKCT